jgi:hypothetical protein
MDRDAISPSKIRKIRKALGNQVVGLEVKSGLDSGGEPAYWVWIILQAGVPEKAWASDNLKSLRSKVIEQLRIDGVSVWIYVRFRDSAELVQAS